MHPHCVLTSLVLSSSLALIAPSALAGGGNPSSVFLNEVYASHAGTDDLEMIELVGTPNASLSGYVVCVVEGEGTGAGTLDRAWDLTGFTVPADGFFVLGDTAEPALDLDIGASNRIENGTETFLLIHSGAPAAVVALLNTNVDAGGGNTTLGALGTICDAVALVDPGWLSGSESIYDGATVVGPDGSNLPAGAFRSGDHPGKWSTEFLDFDDVVNANRPRTPGAPNVESSIRTYGSPKCVGAAGHLRLEASGDTTAGSGAVTIDISNGPTNGGSGGAPAALFFGPAEANVPIAGGCTFLVSAPLNFFPTLDAAGARTLGPTPVPAGTTGAIVYMQAVSFEAGQFLESNALEIEID